MQWQKGAFRAKDRMLHVAPEPVLAKKFDQRFDEYVSIDLDGKRAMRAMDVTALTFADQYFDVIVCNHVLEHVPDDRTAIAELYRVLKPGGWGSIQVPMKGDVTHEDPGMTDPQERYRLYGQDDHVRQYGSDFIDRLRGAGFEVLILPKRELADPDKLDRLSVGCEDEVVLVTRPLGS
jgi:SAM-dependent methyltransferase